MGLIFLLFSFSVNLCIDFFYFKRKIPILAHFFFYPPFLLLSGLSFFHLENVLQGKLGGLDTEWIKLIFLIVAVATYYYFLYVVVPKVVNEQRSNKALDFIIAKNIFERKIIRKDKKGVSGRLSGQSEQKENGLNKTLDNDDMLEGETREAYLLRKNLEKLKD